MLGCNWTNLTRCLGLKDVADQGCTPVQAHVKRSNLRRWLKNTFFSQGFLSPKCWWHQYILGCDKVQSLFVFYYFFGIFTWSSDSVEHIERVGWERGDSPGFEIFLKQMQKQPYKWIWIVHLYLCFCLLKRVLDMWLVGPLTVSELTELCFFPINSRKSPPVGQQPKCYFLLQLSLTPNCDHAKRRCNIWRSRSFIHLFKMSANSTKVEETPF